MAQKTQAYKVDPDQIHDLGSSIKAIASGIASEIDNVSAHVAAYKADEPFGDSVHKDASKPALEQVKGALDYVSEKLVRVGSMVDALAENYQVALNTNIKNTADAATALANARKKVEEATGAGV